MRLAEGRGNSGIRPGSKVNPPRCPLAPSCRLIRSATRPRCRARRRADMSRVLTQSAAVVHVAASQPRMRAAQFGRPALFRRRAGEFRPFRMAGRGAPLWRSAVRL